MKALQEKELLKLLNSIGFNFDNLNQAADYEPLNLYWDVSDIGVVFTSNNLKLSDTMDLLNDNDK